MSRSAGFRDFWLSDRFEPDATAVHLTNIENFLIGEVLTILLALAKMMSIGRD